MIETKIISIGINTIDSNLLNDAYKIFKRDFPKEKGYIINREIYQDFTVFAIGNKDNKFSYADDMIKDITLDMLKELDIRIDDMPECAIYNGVTGTYLYVYNRNGKLITSVRSCFVDGTHDTLPMVETTIDAYSRLYNHMFNSNIFPAGTFANDDCVVEIYTSDPMISKSLPPGVTTNAYKFLDKSIADREAINKAIETVIRLYNNTKAVSTVSTQMLYAQTVQMNNQFCMPGVPVYNMQQQPMPALNVVAPRPCIIKIVVKDLDIESKEVYQKEVYQYVIMI